MLPGRTFLPEDFLLILRRRFWLIVVPFAVIAAATALYVRFLPDVYRAEALIAVVPPKVPESIVKSAAAPVRIEERIPAIRNEIMSRTRLERIIQDLNLYTVERRTQIMEDIVERMKTEVDVRPAGTSAIRVSFTGSDPRTVKAVADRLAALFIDESTRDRKQLIEGTDQFLETTVKETEQRLIEKEKALQTYRQLHDGELPDQVGANQAAAQNQATLIADLSNQIDRALERRPTIEKTITELENQVQTDLPELPGSTAQLLRAARQRLIEIKGRFSEIHPDVKAAERAVATLEAKLETESSQASVSGVTASASPAESARLRRLEEARTQLEQLDRAVARNRETRDEARKRANEYLRRVEAAANHQTAILSLTRDYTQISSLYSGLLSQKEQSNLAANLERREIGEQFSLVDNAHVPARPVSPQRERLNMIGMVVGLLTGLALVALVEYRDSTLKTDDELTRVLGVPVLAVVPLMLSEQERRRSWQRKLALSTLLGGTVFGCLAILAYTFVR